MWEKLAFATRYGRQDVLTMMYDLPAPQFYEYLEGLVAVISKENRLSEDGGGQE